MSGRDGRHPSPAVEATRRRPSAARAPVACRGHTQLRMGGGRAPVGHQPPLTATTPCRSGRSDGDKRHSCHRHAAGRATEHTPRLVPPHSPPPPPALAPRRHPPAPSPAPAVGTLASLGCQLGRALAAARAVAHPARRRGPLTAPWTPTARASWRAQRARGCVTKKAGPYPAPARWSIAPDTRRCHARWVGGAWRVSALRALPRSLASAPLVVWAPATEVAASAVALGLGALAGTAGIRGTRLSPRGLLLLPVSPGPRLCRGGLRVRRSAWACAVAASGRVRQSSSWDSPVGTDVAGGLADATRLPPLPGRSGVAPLLFPPPPPPHLLYPSTVPSRSPTVFLFFEHRP